MCATESDSGTTNNPHKEPFAEESRMAHAAHNPRLRCPLLLTAAAAISTLAALTQGAESAAFAPSAAAWGAGAAPLAQLGAPASSTSAPAPAPSEEMSAGPNTTPSADPNTAAGAHTSLPKPAQPPVKSPQTIGNSLPSSATSASALSPPANAQPSAAATVPAAPGRRRSERFRTPAASPPANPTSRTADSAPGKASWQSSAAPSASSGPSSLGPVAHETSPGRPVSAPNPTVPADPPAAAADTSAERQTRARRIAKRFVEAERAAVTAMYKKNEKVYTRKGLTILSEDVRRAPPSLLWINSEGTAPESACG